MDFLDASTSCKEGTDERINSKEMWAYLLLLFSCMGVDLTEEERNQENFVESGGTDK